jgi:hypothetical protein
MRIAINLLIIINKKAYNSTNLNDNQREIRENNIKKQKKQRQNLRVIMGYSFIQSQQIVFQMGQYLYYSQLS